MKIAVVGSGISGLGAAYFLAPQHAVTVYEKNDYAGGHSRTIDVPTGDSHTAVDTGFIVFNDRNYPCLVKLFEALEVPYEESDMSYAVSIDQGRIEYSSRALFSQAANALRPRFWRMLVDILRFHRKAQRCMDDDAMTLGDCLEQLGMGDWFKRYYLLPMGAAIWNCSIDSITRFPAPGFLRFFKNHGLLSLDDAPQWYTVTGGSRVYVDRLLAACRGALRLNCGVVGLRPAAGQLRLRDTQGGEELFDHVVFACHPDEALRLLEAPEALQQERLGAFPYCENRIVVHGDTDYMPRRRSCWASWNFLGATQDYEQQLSVSYWMNQLQNLDPAYPVILTVNPAQQPRQKLIFDEYAFRHPLFDTATFAAQQKIASLQGRGGVWFCGAWQGYGFHEDGLASAMEVARALGVPLPW